MTGPPNQPNPKHADADLVALALALRCEHCAAPPRTWCTTHTGRRAPHLHATRTLVLQATYWLGYEHGTQHGTGPRPP